MDLKSARRRAEPEPFTRILKRKIWHSYLWCRSFTSPLRMLPSFIIIGTQKGGTTSLYQYIMKHPQILPPLEKEIRFFDYQYHKGLRWYKGHFPTLLSEKIKGLTSRETIHSGEASPNYLFDPRPPDRIKKIIPHVKLIVLLRNPVDRAYSSYQMAFRRGREKLSFAKAIEVESRRLTGELQKIKMDDRYISMNRQWYSYLARGRYIEQIEPWLQNFPREQLLILESGQFFRNPMKVVAEAQQFLGVKPFPLIGHRVYNDGGNYPAMDPGLRKELTQYFAPYNRYLFQKIGREFDWECETS